MLIVWPFDVAILSNLLIAFQKRDSIFLVNVNSNG